MTGILGLARTKDDVDLGLFIDNESCLKCLAVNMGYDALVKDMRRHGLTYLQLSHSLALGLLEGAVDGRLMPLGDFDRI